ncbi:TIGR03086 family metal-binding protein [Marmoricola sp. RAF53]|uniref:TIGR03086 family metal-binding protein n=1 Tax=Marmoricola sp. RAF53 TaxID=3233059 RepID=UPI003F9E3299
MNPIDALERSWNDGATIIARLTAEDLNRPTVCAGWDVKQLLNHTMGECQMMTMVNHGETAGNDRGDLVGDGDGLGETWVRLGEENVASWRASGLDGERTYFYGTFPAGASAVINLGEVLVHSWDLARGIGAHLELDPEQAALVHGLYAAIPLEGMRKGGILAAEVPVPVEVPVAERMLGLLGRQP